MTKERSPQTLPQRYLERKFRNMFKKYFSSFRRLVVCGLFFAIFALLLNRHTWRFDLRHQLSDESNIEFSYAEESIVVEEKKPITIEAETPWLRQQQDEDYLRQALDEELDTNAMAGEEIKQAVSFPEKPVEPELLAEMPVIDNLPAASEAHEEDYSHYEETPSVEIIDDTHSSRRRVRDMKIEIQAKPPYFGPRPVIAVVIDDMGDNVRRTRDISSLAAPLTASFLTYPPHIDTQVARSVKSGHEIMLHVPMQPKSNINLSADILTVDMTPEEVHDKLAAMLAGFPDIKGINNHMGSRLTEDLPRMEEIMKVLKSRELFFLDSKTTPRSVGDKTAKKYGVEYVTRNVFLDNRNELDYILGQLTQAEKIARKNGYAIAIGHPKSQTYEALKKWLPTLGEKQLELVHLSQIVSVLNGRGTSR